MLKSQQKLESEMEKYSKEERSLEGQHLQISHSLSNIFSFPYNEESQIHALKNKLQAENEKYKSLENEEIEVTNELSQAATLEQTITYENDKMKQFLSRYGSIVQQVNSIESYGFYIEDLISQNKALKYQRSVQKGKRNRLNNWIQQTEIVKNEQTKSLNELERQFKELEDKIKIKNDEIKKKNELLHNDDMELSKMILDINEKNKALDQMKKDKKLEIDDAKKEIENKKLQLKQVRKEIDDIKANIISSEINEKKLMMKKIETIKQLEKRIEIEKKNKSASEIKSDVVIQLSKLIDSYVEEIDKIETRNSLLETNLKNLQNISSKKSIIIEELDRDSKPLVKNITDDESLSIFENIYEDKMVQNQCYLNDIKKIEVEIMELENSTKLLKEFLNKNK